MRPGRRVAPGAAETPVADRLYRAIDVALLISSGWDPATQVFAPDREHPLLGYPGLPGRRLRVGGVGSQWCVRRLPGPLRRRGRRRP